MKHRSQSTLAEIEFINMAFTAYRTKKAQAGQFAYAPVWAMADYKRAAAGVRYALGTARLDKVQAAAITGAVGRNTSRQSKGVGVAASLGYLPGRIARLQEEKRKAFALAVGEAYHSRIADLYKSARASVIYGKGGTDGVDNNAYAKSYGHPARWKDAGARIEDGVIILEDYKGKEVARVSVDLKKRREMQFSHPALIGGDLFCILRPGGRMPIADRYDVDGQKNGVAVRMPTPDGAGEYWEHGKTVSACAAERKHKIKALQVQAFVSANQSKVDRAARLIARLCDELPVTFADARAAGHCEQGIKGWCSRHGIDPSGRATLGQIKAADNGSLAMAVVRQVAKTCAVKLIQEHA